MPHRYSYPPRPKRGCRKSSDLRSDLLFEIQSHDGRELHEILSSPEFDRDLRYELYGRLDKLGLYLDEPADLEVRVDGRLIPIAPSIAVCLSHARAGRTIACLTTSVSGSRGPLRVGSADGVTTADLHFLVAESDAPAFWRAVLRTESGTVDLLDRYAHLPFPNCVFADTVWSHIGRFEGSLLNNLPLLVSNLAGLDDHVLTIWERAVEPVLRQQLMSAIAGVDYSPESPNTHRNALAMRQRRVRFGETEILCEWHAKLEPHRNRIHFAVHDGRVFVGIFDRHLS